MINFWWWNKKGQIFKKDTEEAVFELPLTCFKYESVDSWHNIYQKFEPVILDDNGQEIWSDQEASPDEHFEIVQLMFNINSDFSH